MVYLSRIYTKSGDLGQTGLGDGKRVPKDHPRVAAYGDVDELNSVLGLLVAHCPSYAELPLLTRVQNELFDLGADLCVPQAPGEAEGACLRITAAQYESLERAIDRINERLTPLNSFILPGGSTASAWLHLARTVCRRAERSVVALQQHEPLNPAAVIYLNRLSDLLFVLARAANEDGKNDVLWVPGQSRNG
jgi:cob(I)alamin adenosyltransferase